MARKLQRFSEKASGGASMVFFRKRLCVRSPPNGEDPLLTFKIDRSSLKKWPNFVFLLVFDGFLMVFLFAFIKKRRLGVFGFILKRAGWEFPASFAQSPTDLGSNLTCQTGSSWKEWKKTKNIQEILWVFFPAYQGFLW